jgi:hypothetical protein
MTKKAREIKELLDTGLDLKITTLIQSSGAAGKTRSELLLATRLRTEELGKVLDHLLNEFVIVCRQEKASQWGLGRLPIRYWHREFAPELLTVPEASVISTADDEAPPSGATCKQCGSAIVTHGPGRAPDYCSTACKRLSAEGGVTLGEFFDRAPTPLVFAQMAALLVAMDLTAQGLHVAFSTFGPGLVVHDGVNATLLTVLPVSNSGRVPDLKDYVSAAVVFRDGRIRYGGQNPLVSPPEASEDANHVE